MEQTISRIEQPDGSFIVNRIKDGEVQILKETFVSSGEISPVDNEMLTTESIIITRQIGVKTTF